MNKAQTKAYNERAKDTDVAELLFKKHQEGALCSDLVQQVADQVNFSLPNLLPKHKALKLLEAAIVQVKKAEEDLN